MQCKPGPCVGRLARSILLGVLAAVLVSCGADLVFQNEFDPQASNSPLGTSVGQQRLNGYMAGPTKTTDIQWERVPTAIDYEYEVAPFFWYQETPAFVFDEVAAGNRGLVESGTIPQTAPGVDPTVGGLTSLTDGAYAMRVRYTAQASNNGVTSVVFSPWTVLSSQEVLGVPDFFYPTVSLTNGEWFAGTVENGSRFILRIQATGVPGNTATFRMRDQYSGLPNSFDPDLQFYDDATSFDGEDAALGGYETANFNKVTSPLTFTIPTSDSVEIVITNFSGNPNEVNFEARVDY